jgi:hypothetical protein
LVSSHSCGILDFTWSPAQKKAAKAVFNLAIKRELKSIRDHVTTLLKNMPDDHSIWTVEDYLSEKRREFVQKYDYRYSRLMWVFPRLIAEGWLRIDKLRRHRRGEDRSVQKAGVFARGHSPMK